MQSLRGRCQFVTGLFVAIFVVSVVASYSTWSLVRYLQGLSSGEPPDEAAAEVIDSRQATVGILQVVLFVGCGIAFLMWFHGAHKNLKAGGIEGLRYSPGWAVGGFFVPFLNLVRPFQVMKEVWHGSVSLARESEGASREAGAPPTLAGWWWALFLGTNLLGSVAGRLMLAAEELDELLFAGSVTLASDLLDIPAAVLAVLLVRRVTSFQESAQSRREGIDRLAGA